jgi:hypothetical protein
MGFMACPHGALTNVDSSRLIPTGSRYKGVDGDEYIYLKGVASTAAGSWVQYYSDGTDYVTALLTETIAENGANVAVALAATIADTYGWYQICGEVEGASLISNVAGADQFATTTAGSLDDAGTTTIHGIQLIDTAAAAGNVTYSINYPHTNVA